MRSDTRSFHRIAASGVARILVPAVLWLIVVTCLHHWMNAEAGSARIIRVGYMPVITNLAVPILDHVSKASKTVRFKAVKFASFAEMAESLRSGAIHAAFIIAPLAVVLRQQGADVKIVYIGNRHESTFVARKTLDIRSIEGFRGRTVAVPMRYSGHYLSIMDLMAERTLDNEIVVVEMNPPDMAAALTAGNLDGYFVGEPFAAQTLLSGDASLVYRVEDLWPGFICNLAIVRHDLIESDPRVVARLVQGAARSGLWASHNPEAAASIASRYWNQSEAMIRFALTSPAGRIVYDRFVPMEAELEHLAGEMVHHGLLSNGNIDGLIDDRFARAADLSGVDGLEDILREP